MFNQSRLNRKIDLCERGREREHAGDHSTRTDRIFDAKFDAKFVYFPCQTGANAASDSDVLMPIHDQSEAYDVS